MCVCMRVYVCVYVCVCVCVCVCVRETYSHTVAHLPEKCMRSFKFNLCKTGLFSYEDKKHFSVFLPGTYMSYNEHGSIFTSLSLQTTPTAEGLGEGTAELCVSAQRFDLQLLSPMYPGRLIKLVSNIAGPSSNLLYHCHSHTQLKVSIEFLRSLLLVSL